MASSRGVISLASMADFLTNPVDIRFGSMPSEFTAPAVGLVMDNAATTPI
jgi:hypothetical protein